MEYGSHRPQVNIKEIWSNQSENSDEDNALYIEYGMGDERSNIQKLVIQNQAIQMVGKYPFNLNTILANNMDQYLYDCRHLISERIINAIPEHKYHRKQFERISEFEILEYRYMMEKDIERGINALNQVQLMEMLLQERKKRRSPQFPYQMGTVKNVQRVVEGLAFSLKLRMPTPLVNTAVDMLKIFYEKKPYNPRESPQQRKEFELTVVANALNTVKGCELHRDGEIGDLTCRFKHLSVTSQN